MAYTSLYRRFRPETFDEVIGQAHIVRTLINQLKNGSVGHAYLFTGTRGVGKTSVAKMFARAVNCLSPVNGSPCGKCEVCRQLISQTNFDIQEIDAASNNSVDQIRELIEKINFPPTVGRYKVYIIDEVHMLSRSAHNALLKTLEEPPSYAIFILATTEVHQIPPTILSRCLRFDFRLVPTPVIASHIKKVYKEAGVSFEDAAVEVIAEAGAGSVRDALSVADMCLSYCDNKVTYEKVLEVLGASDPKKIGELAKATLYGDVGKALNMAKTIADLGKSVAMLSKDLAEFVRNIMFIKNCPNAESVLSLPVELFKTMKELGDTFLNQRLLFVLNVFSSLEGELRYSSQQRVLFDAAIVKACVGEASDAKGEAAYGQGADLAAVEERIKRLEAKVSQQNDYFKLEERIRALESKKPAIDLTLLDRIARLEEALKDLKEVGNTDAAEDSAKEQSETNIDYKEKDGVVPVFDEMPFFIDEQEDKKKDEEAPLFVLDTLDEPLPFDALEEKEEKPKGVYGARKLFDYVMTKLRRETYDDGECKNKFLVLALSAGEPEIKGEDLVIYLPSEATVNLLSQKKNRDKINGILKEISDYKVDFKARLKLSEENTTQYILKMFGDDVKIKP